MTCSSCSTSRASALIDAVVLAWRHDLGGFDERAWLIPAIDIPQHVSTSGYNFRLPLWVSPDVPGRFDGYRVRRGEVRWRCWSVGLRR